MAQAKFAVLEAKDSQIAGNLPDDYIVEYRPLADGESAVAPYEEKNEAQLNALLSAQDSKLQGFLVADEAKRKAQADAAQAKRDATDQKKKDLQAIDLSVFTSEQQTEIQKIIDLALD